MTIILRSSRREHPTILHALLRGPNSSLADVVLHNCNNSSNALDINREDTDSMARHIGPRFNNSREAPGFWRTIRSDGLRWLASFAAALLTAIWVVNLPPEQLSRRLTETARPAYIHGGITSEEQQDLVTHELEGGTSKKAAHRPVVTRCQDKLRAA
jgi:hypothetical protein